jgi:hypothetical protein
MSNQGKTQALESFLNPSILRSNLIAVALYITAFELLHDSIVERLRRFYARPLDTTSEPVPGPDYESEVLQGRKKVLPASLAWLKKLDVIDDTDIGNFEKVKELRDKLTHEMGQLLWDGIPSDLPARFLDIVSLLDKIELWWTVNVDVMRPEEIDVATIVPARSAGLRLLMQVATLSEEESRKYLDEAIRLTRPPREKVQ